MYYWTVLLDKAHSTIGLYAVLVDTGDSYPREKNVLPKEPCGIPDQGRSIYLDKGAAAWRDKAATVPVLLVNQHQAANEWSLS